MCSVDGELIQLKFNYEIVEIIKKPKKSRVDGEKECDETSI